MGAAPFAALGFVTYNGLPAEKIFYCWIKSNILTPKKLVNKPTNFYFEILKPTYQQLEKEGLKNENTKKLFKQDKEKYKVPKGVQDTIPISKIWEDGIFYLVKINIQKVLFLQI